MDVKQASPNKMKVHLLSVSGQAGPNKRKANTGTCVFQAFLCVHECPKGGSHVKRQKGKKQNDTGERNDLDNGRRGGG